jgi:hypothetical protein
MLGSTVANMCSRYEEDEKYEQNYRQQTWRGRKKNLEMEA